MTPDDTEPPDTHGEAKDSELSPRLGLGRAAMRHLIAPVALLSVGVVLLTLTLVVIAADSQNRLAVQSAGHLAGSALRVEAERIANFVRDYAFWNDSVQNLVIALDEDWADANVGTWAYDNLGVSASLVVDGQGRSLYESIEGARDAAALAERFSAQLTPLVEAARAAVGTPGDSPGEATTYLLLDGAVAIAAAAAIKWEDDRPVPMPGGRPAVLVFVRTVDPAMLERFEQLYLLPGARLTSTEEDLPDSTPMEAIDGVVLGRLAWTGTRPGTDLVRVLAVPMLGIVLLAGGLLVLIVRRARASTAEIAHNHRRLASQARALGRSTAALQTALTEAAEANMAKSAFLARMSHELRTPLNAILGFSEIISGQLYGPAAGERYREYAHLIHDSGSHLRSLIDDILDLSRIEAGRLALREEAEVEIDGLVQQCIGLLAPKVEAKSLKLESRVEPIVLRADPRALKQVLLNLLSNATKFTPDCGSIMVRVESGTDGVVLSVADNGRGMTGEDLAHVFEPFGRARAGVAGEGAGLGLGIARGLAELHGGSLTIASEPGDGTTATVWLPAWRCAASESLAVAG